MINQVNTFKSVTNTSIATGDQNQPQISISRVRIPRIQRAYAQGREFKKETKIRNQFIDAIFKNLVEDTPMDLHFIYGAVTSYQDNGVAKFQLDLLDGQQRFTTLFLLHWYLMNREQGNNPQITQALQSFIYETRSTTHEFCKSLRRFNCVLDNAKPSEVIKKAKWYYRRFDKDSSIRGMLVMLDAIHEKYNSLKASGLLSRVDNLQFYVLPLVGYNMAEELYIQMNQRGLPLSPFDNFKADFTGAMIDAKIAQKDTISNKLDTKWIDIFWSPGVTDYHIAYMHFFSRFFAYRYLVDSGIQGRDIQNTALPINLFYTQSEAEENRDEYLGFDKYAEQLKAHPEYFGLIEKILDALHDSNTMLVVHNTLRPIWDAYQKGNFFVNVDVPFSQSLLVVFGAVCDYISQFNSFDEKLFRQWMRVVWNVVENTNIDSLTAALGAMGNLNAMITQIMKSSPRTISDFYDAISKVTITNVSGAAKEEIEKARRIAQNEQWLAELEDAEKHPYLKGSIRFFYDPTLTLQEFIHNRDLVKPMFDHNGITTPYREQHILIRAIVSNLKTWNKGSLQNRYITENAESNKRLKILLLDNDDVRQMFLNVLKASQSDADVIRELNQVTKTNMMPLIADPDRYWDNKLVITHNALCSDVKLYDWMNTQSSPVCVYEYKGHYSVAIPRVWYDRFLIDSHRDQIAISLMNGLWMRYYDDGSGHATLQDYKNNGRFIGENITLLKNLQKGFRFAVSFQKDHNVRVYVECPNEAALNIFVSQLTNIGQNCKKDKKSVYLDVDAAGKLKAEFRYLLHNEFSTNLQAVIYSLYHVAVNAISKI